MKARGILLYQLRKCVRTRSHENFRLKPLLKSYLLFRLCPEELINAKKNKHTYLLSRLLK